MTDEERTFLFSKDHRRELAQLAGECDCVENFVRGVPGYIQDVVEEDDELRERYDLPDIETQLSVYSYFDEMALAKEYGSGMLYEESLPEGMDRVITFTLGGGRFDIYAKDFRLPDGEAAEIAVFHGRKRFSTIPEGLFWPGAITAEEVLMDAAAKYCNGDRMLRPLWACSDLGALREDMSQARLLGAKDEKGTFIQIPLKRLWRADGKLRELKIAYLVEEEPGENLAVYSGGDIGVMLMTDPVRNEILSDSTKLVVDRIARSVLNGDRELYFEHDFCREIDGLLDAAATDEEKARAAKFRERFAPVQEVSPGM